MPTNYEPSDGDYIEADYSKFFNDIQAQAGYDFGEYPEICTSLEHGEIYICGANEESSEWIWQQSFPIPQGWEPEQVRKMFSGYVYLEPSTRRTQVAADSGGGWPDSYDFDDEDDRPLCTTCGENPAYANNTCVDCIEKGAL